MDIDNFVYYQKGGKVMSLGYEVDCKMINNDLSVPAGLFILNKSIHSNTKNMNELFDSMETEKEDVINNELYDKLLGLMKPKNEKNKVVKIKKRSSTRKKVKRTKSRRKTRTKRR